jgi:hypothetical protein
MLGQASLTVTGLAEVLGPRLCGFPARSAARTNHLRQLPLGSQKLRIVIDRTVSLARKGDTAELGSLGHPARLDA